MEKPTKLTSLEGMIDTGSGTADDPMVVVPFSQPTPAGVPPADYTVTVTATCPNCHTTMRIDV